MIEISKYNSADDLLQSLRGTLDAVSVFTYDDFQKAIFHSCLRVIWAHRHKETLDEEGIKAIDGIYNAFTDISFSPNIFQMSPTVVYDNGLYWFIYEDLDFSTNEVWADDMSKAYGGQLAGYIDLKYCWEQAMEAFEDYNLDDYDDLQEWLTTNALTPFTSDRPLKEKLLEIFLKNNK